VEKWRRDSGVHEKTINNFNYYHMTSSSKIPTLSPSIKLLLPSSVSYWCS